MKPRFVAPLASLAITLAHAASAQNCSLALSIGLDISRSMDSTDFSLEFEGTAQALRDPHVQAVILSQPGGVALTAFEWGGQAHQRVIEGWTLMRSEEDIEAFAQKIVDHRCGSMGQHTGTGSAVEFGYKQLSTGPRCGRFVVDISSDGYYNDGPAPTDFYATGSVDWVTVNALVVGGKSLSAICISSTN